MIALIGDQLDREQLAIDKDGGINSIIKVLKEELGGRHRAKDDRRA